MVERKRPCTGLCNREDEMNIKHICSIEYDLLAKMSDKVTVKAIEFSGEQAQTETHMAPGKITLD